MHPTFTFAQLICFLIVLGGIVIGIIEAWRDR